MRKREAMKEQIGEEEKEIKKTIACCVLLVVQVELLPTVGGEGERRRKRLRSVHFQLLAAARGRMHRHCSCGGKRASLQI